MRRDVGAGSPFPSSPPLRFSLPANSPSSHSLGAAAKSSFLNVAVRMTSSATFRHPSGSSTIIDLGLLPEDALEDDEATLPVADEGIDACKRDCKGLPVAEACPAPPPPSSRPPAVPIFALLGGAASAAAEAEAPPLVMLGLDIIALTPLPLEGVVEDLPFFNAPSEAGGGRIGACDGGSGTEGGASVPALSRFICFVIGGVGRHGNLWRLWFIECVGLFALTANNWCFQIFCALFISRVILGPPGSGYHG